ncbi:MAG: hypothetical protein ACFFCS_24835 [Candidatus Hodarchaeota archaeon]
MAKSFNALGLSSSIIFLIYYGIIVAWGVNLIISTEIYGVPLYDGEIVIIIDITMNILGLVAGLLLAIGGFKDTRKLVGVGGIMLIIYFGMSFTSLYTNYLIALLESVAGESYANMIESVTNTISFISSPIYLLIAFILIAVDAGNNEDNKGVVAIPIICAIMAVVWGYFFVVLYNFLEGQIGSPLITNIILGLGFNSYYIMIAIYFITRKPLITSGDLNFVL